MKTMIGVGVAKPPPAAARVPPPAPAAAQATFAKPTGLGPAPRPSGVGAPPPPPLAVQAPVPPPSAAAAAALGSPQPTAAAPSAQSDTAADAYASLWQDAITGELPAAAVAAARAAAQPAEQQVQQKQPTAAERPPAPRPKTNSGMPRSALFELDAPTTGTMARPAAAVAQEPPKPSLFELDSPRFPTTTAERASAAEPAAAHHPLAHDYDPVGALFGRAAESPGAAAPARAPAPVAAAAPAPLMAADAQAGPATTAEPSELDKPEPQSLREPENIEPFADDPDSSIDELAEMNVPFPPRASAPPPAAVPRATAGAPATAQSAVVAAAEESFDDTLQLPRPGDSLEERRSRLLGRLKAARTAFKVLGHLDVTDEQRKDSIALFAEYEAKLKSAATTTLEPDVAPDATKKDTTALHRQLPREALDELERSLSRIEERLLALDEYVPEQAFRARINKDRHPPKLLLRYARLLGSRRFNVGFRRDRFEFLATELLTVKGAEGRLRLLPRDKAKAVLQQILVGLPQASDETERAAAVAHLRETLERLGTIDTHEDFFESGFFLDVHGYKVSMREQATNPEFLYLSVALNVEIQNRIEGWIASVERMQKTNQLTQDGPPREFLYAQLRAQEESVQSVFGGFRRPKERQATGTQARAQEAKIPAKEPRKKQKKATTKPSRGSELAEVMRDEMVKTVAATIVAVIAFSYVLYSTGALSSADSGPKYFTEQEMHDLSPLLVRALVLHKDTLVGMVGAQRWYALDAHGREDAADKLAKKLAVMGVKEANVVCGKQPAITIDVGVVTFTDKTVVK